MKNILFILAFITFFSACNLNERKAFKESKKINTEDSYTSFLDNYPDGQFAPKAKDLRQNLDSINIIISTFLGNEERNYYGDSLPDKLDVLWKFYLECSRCSLLVLGHIVII